MKKILEIALGSIVLIGIWIGLAFLANGFKFESSIGLSFALVFYVFGVLGVAGAVWYSIRIANDQRFITSFLLGIIGGVIIVMSIAGVAIEDSGKTKVTIKYK